MKIGSLVECVFEWHKSRSEYPEVTFPVRGNIYTVREIRGDCILLEEIINPKEDYLEGHSEASFDMEAFREVQPPMSLEFINELVNEKATL